MKRILVVDDEPDILALAKAILESAGYDVRVAKTGEEGLAAIERERPNLVLLDVILPGVSGLDVLRRIRGDPSKRGLNVVLFTALGTEVKMMLGKNEGADGYLGKPFTSTQLIGLVDRLMDGSGRIR